MTGSSSWGGQNHPDGDPGDPAAQPTVPGGPRPGPEHPDPPGYGQPEYSQPGYGQPQYGPPAYGQPRSGQPAGPQPGVVPLRPLSLGDILNGAFACIRNNPAALGLSAIVLTVSGVATALVSLAISNAATSLSPGSDQRSSAQLSHLGGGALTLLAAVLLSVVPAVVGLIILSGVLASVFGRDVLGLKVSIREAWRITAPRLAAVFGAALLGGSIVVGLWIPYVVILIVLILAHAPGALIVVVGVLGFPAMLAVTLAAGVLLSLAPAAIVLERLGPWRGLRRSAQLVRGSFWRVLGILLLTLAIVGVARLVLRIPFLIIEAAAGGSVFGTAPVSASAPAIIAAVGSIVANTIAEPLLGGAVGLLYLDLRMRREGLDLVLRNAAQGQQVSGDEFATIWRPPGPGAGPAATPAAW